MLFQITESNDWIKTLLIALALPIFAAIVGIVGYFGKKWFDRNFIKVDLKLKEADLKSKELDIEQKARKETLELSDKLMDAINLINDLSADNQAKSQAIIDNQRKHGEEYEILEDAKELLEKSLAESADYIRIIEQVCERKHASFRTLMSKARIAYWETDGRGKQVYVSSDFYGLFGVTEENSENWINRVVPADQLRIAQEWKRFIADKETNAAIEFRGIDEDGAAFDCKSIYSIVRDLSGEVVEVRGVTVRRDSAV